MSPRIDLSEDEQGQKMWADVKRYLTVWDEECIDEVTTEHARENMGAFAQAGIDLASLTAGHSSPESAMVTKTLQEYDVETNVIRRVEEKIAGRVQKAQAKATLVEKNATVLRGVVAWSFPEDVNEAGLRARSIQDRDTLWDWMQSHYGLGDDDPAEIAEGKGGSENGSRTLPRPSRSATPK